MIMVIIIIDILIKYARMVEKLLILQRNILSPSDRMYWLVEILGVCNEFSR